MNTKTIAVVACIVMAVFMIAPIANPVKASPAIMNVIQFKYYSDPGALFTDFTAGLVDSDQFALTAPQYATINSSTSFIVEPVAEAGEDEIAFNNNFTDGVTASVRSPMNCTDFRNALNMLVNKAGVIDGPILGGFATECDTQVPTPLMNLWIAQSGPLDVSGPAYPWAFSETNALTLLYNDGWYSHTIYTSFTGPNGLQATFLNGSLAGRAGTTGGVIYPANDPNDQWGGDFGLPRNDNATTYAAEGIAGNPIAGLVGYYRTGSADGRKTAGLLFDAELTAIGCPHTTIGEPTLTALKPYVITAQHYDWATLGYTMGAPPTFLFGEMTLGGIYPNGPNPYLIQDANTSYYATQMWNAPNNTYFTTTSEITQYNLVWNSFLVPIFNPATFCAYSSNLLGQNDIIGYGSQANGGAAENLITLNSRKTNTIVYTGPPASTPSSNILYLGLASPPDMVNPIFADTVYDFQVQDEIFTYPLNGNPYNILPGSAIQGNPIGGDLPWSAYAWTVQPCPNPTGHDLSGDGSLQPTWTNVTLWFRNYITWQDGVPFTDDDVNFTIYISAVYGDAYDNVGMVWCANVTGANPTYAPYFYKDPTPADPSGNYTCSILVSSPSALSLYTPLYQLIPYHLYKYIVPNNLTAAEQGTATDGLHGLWPGSAAVAGNILPGAPFTLSQVQNDPETTLVGTGPFKYRVGSTNAGSFAAGGGITLDAYNGFFLTPAPGEIAWQYTWVPNQPLNNSYTVAMDQPEGGYFKIGLVDLEYLAFAYGTTGTPPSSVSLTEAPGSLHSWNPAADLAAPAGVVGLSDLVTLALHYNWIWGNVTASGSPGFDTP